MNTTIPNALQTAIEHQQAGRLSQAEAVYRQILQIKPDHPDALHLLGMVAHQEGRNEVAVELIGRAIRAKPSEAMYHNNLGLVLEKKGTLDAAVESFRKAILIKPGYAKAHCNLGDVLQSQGNLKEAITSYQEALSLTPGYAEAHFRLGQALLSMGMFYEGWQEYEYRWEGGSPRKPRPATVLPQWTGQPPLVGDSLLIFAEQGMGDKIQFSRYLPLAADRFKGRISIVVDHPLLTLFRRSFPEIEILDATPDDQSPWQWHCPLLSLPLAFNTLPETILRKIPYLIPDPMKTGRWKAKIDALDLPAESRKIGVVWKPGSAMNTASQRSLTLQQLAPLLNHPGCTWFSLQKEPDPDKSSWVASGKLVDWAEEFCDFDETTALLVNLDLVISVDTSVAHLAGGLGCPTWLFNRHASEWRWMRDRDDSPWYPSMRIFTQKIAGDWDEVVKRMSAELLTMGETTTVR